MNYRVSYHNRMIDRDFPTIREAAIAWLDLVNEFATHASIPEVTEPSGIVVWFDEFKCVPITVGAVLTVAKVALRALNGGMTEADHVEIANAIPIAPIPTLRFERPRARRR